MSKSVPIYSLITGCNIAVINLSVDQLEFLAKIVKKYNSKQDWTRFSAWWNAEFRSAGISPDSVVWRICQDLEARLGIEQGKVSPPDYRDYLSDLIDIHFKSRQEFCHTTNIDPGQLSRILSGNGHVSMEGLQRICKALKVRLVFQKEEESRTQLSIERAKEAIKSILEISS